MSLTDEGLYVYLAREVYLGKAPYSDFFYVHPPLYQYLTALVFKMLGVGLIQARLIPLFFSILSMPLFYFSVRRFYSLEHAVFSTVLLSLSYGVVAFTRVALMNAEMVFFTILSYLLFMEGFMKEDRPRLLLAGMCVGVASLFRLFGLMSPAIFLAFLLLRRPAKAFEYFMTVLVGLGVVMVPFLFLSSSHWDQLVSFHALKSSYGMLAKLKLALVVVSGHYFMLFALGVFGAFIVFCRRERSDADVFYLLAAVFGFAAVLFLKYSVPVSSLYFIYASPSFAMLGGLAACKIIRFSAIILLLLFITGVVLPWAIDLGLLSVLNIKTDSDVRDVVAYLVENTNSSAMVCATPYPAMFALFYSGRETPDMASDLSNYRFLDGGVFNQAYFDEITHECSYFLVMDVGSGGCFDNFMDAYVLEQSPDENPPKIEGRIKESFRLDYEKGHLKVYLRGQ